MIVKRNSLSSLFNDDWDAFGEEEYGVDYDSFEMIEYWDEDIDLDDDEIDSIVASLEDSVEKSIYGD